MRKKLPPAEPNRSKQLASWPTVVLAKADTGRSNTPSPSKYSFNFAATLASEAECRMSWLRRRLRPGRYSGWGGADRMSPLALRRPEHIPQHSIGCPRSGWRHRLYKRSRGILQRTTERRTLRRRVLPRNQKDAPRHLRWSEWRHRRRYPRVSAELGPNATKPAIRQPLF
jgi:hypothetical protein